MAFKLANRAFVLTSTTGTGSISLGSVVAGYQSFSAAGITDGDTVRYTIEDGTSWEIGTGTLSNSVGTMARSVIDSSGGGSALTLSGNAKVFLTAAAGDILVEVVEDTSPQLGGNLDVQANEITTSTSNGNVKITPNGSGVVEVKGANGNDGTLQLNCSANSHGVKIKSPPHSAGATYTLTLPNDDGSSGQSLTSDGSGNLSFTTITSNATHTGEVTGSGALTIADNIVDEANLKVSNSPTNGYFLSAQSGNTGGLTWAAAGAELYAANPNSATDPVATGQNSVAIGNGSSVASAGVSGIAIGKDANTAGDNSFAAGDTATITYQGDSSVALGKAHVSGQEAIAAVVGYTSSSYGATSVNAVAIGKGAKATGTQSIAIGGMFPTSSSSSSVVIGGYASQATDQQAICIGGLYSLASAYDSLAMGSYAKAAHVGKAARASGQFAAQGDAQGGQFILRENTTDATPSVMATNQYTAGSTNQIIAASDTCITFHGTVVAMQNGAQAHAGWEIKGMLVNDGGTTTLALGNVSDMAATNASSWAVALSADNTNNALAITVTGEASHNIRWVANVQTSEVTYA